MSAPQWETLAAVDARQDPWLAIADACGFVDHGGADARTAWAVSVQVDAPSYRPVDVPGLRIRQSHEGSAFFTAQATRQAMATLGQDPRVQRVLLAAPLAQRRPWPRWAGVPAPAPAAARSPSADKSRPSNVLLGVIDDGCPFAHPDLLRPGGGLRVLRLWNQDAVAHGLAPAGFDQGVELTRADLATLSAAASRGGRLDSAMAYKAAGLPRLQQAHSHGAQVLGLLAGARRWRGPVAAGAPVMAWAAAGTPSREADMAFVQLPQQVLHSVSVPALEHHAYDGLRYLCNLAVAQGYGALVVVLAYESWIGPHDGSSWFEQALDALLNPARSGPAALAGLQVRLVLPAGNSRERAVHAQIDEAGGDAELHWHQPPGHEGPTLLELWAPRTVPEDVLNDVSALQLRITPPAGPSSPWLGWGAGARWGSGADSLAVARMHLAAPGGTDRHRLALRVAPTAAWVGATAPHGTWRLDLRGPRGALRNLHARIGRVAPALPSPRQPVQPHFVQRTPAQVNADRLHTLNGHACGHFVSVAGATLDAAFPHADQPALTVQGTSRRYPAASDPPGRSLLHGRATAYSGAGPSEGPRRRPDASVAVEDSLLWPGVPSLGPTAAGVSRLSGTSAAAPLLARHMADERPDEERTGRVMERVMEQVTVASPDPAMGALTLPR